MKTANWKIWIACAVVFIVMSPQVAAASVSMSLNHYKEKACIVKKHTRNYMKSVAKRYAYTQIKHYGWSEYDYKSLLTLWTRESRWDYRAKNPHSTAYGIAQMLDFPKNTSVEQQVNAGMKYIKKRYKTPTLALSHHFRTGWY
jgi:hypothetical protein